MRQALRQASAGKGSVARNTQTPAARAAGEEKPSANPLRLATAAAIACIPGQRADR